MGVWDLLRQEPLGTQNPKLPLTRSTESKPASRRISSAVSRFAHGAHRLKLWLSGPGGCSIDSCFDFRGELLLVLLAARREVSVADLLPIGEFLFAQRKEIVRMQMGCGRRFL
jgi:hypothetical protein